MSATQQYEAKVSGGSSVPDSLPFYDIPPGPDVGTAVDMPINTTAVNNDDKSRVKESTTSVKESTSNLKATTPSESEGETVIGIGTALYQWKARHETELSFGRNDIIEVLEQGEMKWRGRLQKVK